MGGRKNDPEMWGMIILVTLAAMVLGCNFHFLPLAINQYHRARTYVKNSCLVLNADWERCAIRRSSKIGDRQCYEPQWYIRFQDETQEKTKISGKEYCVSESREDAVHELPPYLEEYQIGRAYPCYHSPSNPSKKATFIEYTIRGSKLLLIISGTTTLVSLGILLIITYKFYRRINNQHRRPESIQLNTVAATGANIEENTPLSPPQPSMKTLDAELEKRSIAV